MATDAQGCKNISKAENAGFAPEPDDMDDMDQGELMEMSQKLFMTKNNSTLVYM